MEAKLGSRGLAFIDEKKLPTAAESTQATKSESQEEMSAQRSHRVCPLHSPLREVTADGDDCDSVLMGFGGKATVTMSMDNGLRVHMDRNTKPIKPNMVWYPKETQINTAHQAFNPNACVH